MINKQLFEGFGELFHFIMASQGVGKGWLVGGKPELNIYFLDASAPQ